MNRELPEFNILYSLGTWALAVVVLCAAAAFVGLVVSLATLGKEGPKFFWSQVKRLGSEFGGLSWGRVAALTSLTIKESLRRKALYIFAVFALLFMFAGWFFGGLDSVSARPYVVFVLTTVRWLSLPLAVLLACWGLPADIKARSLHTVVTKPVRRTEIVLGRILGYSAVTAVVLLVMGAIGYVWIQRSVPEFARDQLIGRVPVFADDLKFLGPNGESTASGLNVGDIWEYRSYINGGSLARGIFIYYDFDDTAEQYTSQGESIPLEYNFEVFRSYKGDVGEGVLKGEAADVVGTRAQFAVLARTDDTVAPDSPEAAAQITFEGPQLRLRFPGDFPFEIKEFNAGVEDSVQPLPLTFEQSVDGDLKTFDLLKDGLRDLDGDGEADDLAISVRLVDSQQYLGVAREDLFVRLPDKSFLSGYAKTIASVMLTCVLVIIIGTTASTFVKGPVATLVTIGVVGVGFFAHGFADEYLGGFQQTGQAQGGGPLESAYRMVTQKSLTTDLQESTAISAVKLVDRGLLRGMIAAFHVLPDMRTFDLVPYVASGFDPPFWTAFMPGLLTVIGFLLPCLVLGYFSLQLRELESK